MTQVLHLPLDSIMDAALPRDRIALDEESLFELRGSIARDGQRQPIEVFELAQPQGPQRYGLISGLRRLTALRALHELAPDRHRSVAAFLVRPQSLAAAMARMVEENDMRAELSPWEKGRVAAVAVQEGIFPTLDAAIAGLYPDAGRQRRSRLRSLARVAEELGDLIDTPQALSLRQMLRLAAALRQDFAGLIRHVLQEHPRAGIEAQWAALLPVLDEAEQALKDPAPYAPGRPRRLISPRSGLFVRREMTRRGWVLHFTGPEATGIMMETVLDEIERMYGP